MRVLRFGASVPTFDSGGLDGEQRQCHPAVDRWNNGKEDALSALMDEVYSELRRLAHSYARREKSGQTLQTTALVNEAYIRLIDQSRVQWQNRAHFFGIAAQCMRRILVDRA